MQESREASKKAGKKASSHAGKQAIKQASKQAGQKASKQSIRHLKQADVANLSCSRDPGKSEACDQLSRLQFLAFES